MAEKYGLDVVGANPHPSHLYSTIPCHFPKKKPKKQEGFSEILNELFCSKMWCTATMKPKRVVLIYHTCFSGY